VFPVRYGQTYRVELSYRTMGNAHNSDSYINIPLSQTYKSEGKRSLGRPRRMWVDNIKIDLRHVRVAWNR
jgi:hypothetical protein